MNRDRLVDRVCRIASEIDAGGVGRIYSASDPKIRRDVAIKVLPANLQPKVTEALC